MKYLVTILVVTISFATQYLPVPNVTVVPMDEINAAENIFKSSPSSELDQHLIYQVPDLRSTAGSPGKSITFAEDGQNIVVIYARFTGDPTNFFAVYVAYSTDRGNNWIHYGPLSTLNCRRVYGAVDDEENWPSQNDLRVHFSWQQTQQVSGSYDSSVIFFAKEVMFPDGLITAAFRLPNSGTWDLWFPCIGVKDSFVIITAGNNSTFLTTNDCHIWRSTDYGETWDEGRLFSAGPLDWMATPHFRFGSGGYMFFLWNRQLESNPALYWPYYCESFDYGLTWTDPQLIWQNTPPYPDMSNLTGWWYTYDCEVVNDTPVATMKLSSGNYDFGEVWVYRPDSGVAGNWHFKGKRLVGGDSTAPQTIARYATVAKDDRGDIIVGYQANFITAIDTGFDIGIFVRPVDRDTWLDLGLVTHGRYQAATDQAQLEFAHNAPIVGTPPIDTILVGLIWTNAQDYPTTGNLYFEWSPVLSNGIAESNRPVMNQTNLTVTPNPFRSSVKFIIPTQMGEAKLSIFDITGKLVRKLNTSMMWDGKNSDGIKVNAGVYFYHISAGDSQYQGKVVLTR